jgi:hypothetical protein
LVSPIIANGGAGFETGDIITSTGASTTSPVLTVASISGTGAITGVTITEAGDTAAPVSFVSSPDFEHVRKLMSQTCVTVEGNMLRWRLNAADEVGEVNIERI